MTELILEKIKQVATERNWANYTIDTETIFVEEPEFYLRLEPNVLYFIADYGDVYDTAKVTVSSASNIIVFTKQFKPMTLMFFSDYIQVKYENGIFTPFHLTFIKTKENV